MNLKALYKWQQSRSGLIVSGLIAAGLVYVFASLAIDSGSLLDYAITILLFIAALQNFIAGVFYKPSKEKKHV